MLRLEGLTRHALGDLPRRLAAFGGVGLASTLASFAAYRALLFVPPTPAAVTAGWAAGLVVSFLGNKTLTFRQSGPASLGQAARFVGTYGGQLGYSLVGYWIALDVLGLPPTLAFAAVTGPGALFAFAMMHFVVFSPQRA